METPQPTGSELPPLSDSPLGYGWPDTTEVRAGIDHLNKALESFLAPHGLPIDPPEGFVVVAFDERQRGSFAENSAGLYIQQDTYMQGGYAALVLKYPSDWALRRGETFINPTADYYERVYPPGTIVLLQSWDGHARYTPRGTDGMALSEFPLTILPLGSIAARLSPAEYGRVTFNRVPAPTLQQQQFRALQEGRVPPAAGQDHSRLIV